MNGCMVGRCSAEFIALIGLKCSAWIGLILPHMVLSYLAISSFLFMPALPP